jgi:hypothetical protein
MKPSDKPGPIHDRVKLIEAAAAITGLRQQLIET